MWMEEVMMVTGGGMAGHCAQLQWRFPLVTMEDSTIRELHSQILPNHKSQCKCFTKTHESKVEYAHVWKLRYHNTYFSQSLIR